MTVTEILKNNLHQKSQPSLKIEKEFIFKNILLFDNYLLWHADPLLDNYRKISKYTTAVSK
jgi:hypothetical protein